jgi:hypothetical protein
MYSQLLKKRHQAIMKFKLPMAIGLQDARVSSKAPLQCAGQESKASGFAFVLFNNQILLGQGKNYLLPTVLLVYVSTVLSVYAKLGGKNGTHSWVSDSSNIAAVSYVPMQIFEHMIGPQFRAIPQALALNFLQVKQFTLLPAMSLLCTLDTAPQSVMENVSIRISGSDYSQFLKLERCIQNIILAIKFINNKSKQAKDQEEAAEDW